jgi:hypothetical protein
MAELSKKLHRAEDGQLRFWCPGCKTLHGIYVAPRPDGKLHPQWGYNGNPDSPTFTPSILVTWEGPTMICHSFVTDGQIRFLSDCTHQLAGQTVKLPDFP